tara:strand:+ start:59 stop:286 length:228 start_codon:yes stop_codon:yes gene_type:complete
MNKIKKLNKKYDTLEFVRKSIEIDLDKISKKSKEFISLKTRHINLTIETFKTLVKMHEIAIEDLRNLKSMQKVSA